MPDPRHIAHVDMDEFFAAVEKLDHPEYRGKPLLIGGDPKGRGVVSTASYEARPFGCRSAMPMSVALRLCPHAIVLPVRGSRYSEMSDQVFAVLEKFSPLIEPVSIDEAFVDLTGTQRLLGEPADVAGRIKQAIRKETGLTASVGLAPNKFLAKLASDLHKPDGLTIITPDTIQSTLDPLKVGKLWGVGEATASRLEKIGVRTIAQLRQVPVADLVALFGSGGEHFANLARGIDDRPVYPDSQAKSIGQETTFARDLADREEVLAVLLGQVEHVARRCRRAGLAARVVTVKIRVGTVPFFGQGTVPFSGRMEKGTVPFVRAQQEGQSPFSEKAPKMGTVPNFQTLTRGETLPAPTDLTDELWASARKLFLTWAQAAFKPVRLIGATASGLSRSDASQGLLFDQADRDRRSRLDRAVDDIVTRFGRRSIGRAAGEGEPKEEEGKDRKEDMGNNSVGSR